MKRLIILAVALFAVAILVPTGTALAAKGGKNAGCATIPGGTLFTSDGNLITPGYDEFGYNYQAHLFNGIYSDVDRAHGGPYSDVSLNMKWNDAWMSNKDCDGDGKLDRHYGYASYIGSGAWETNHMWGTNADGTKWNYFVKIVAAPADATKVGGIWYTADGTEIGPVIWGQFAIIQQVSNDPAYDEHGLLYKSPAGPGFGKW